MDVIELDGRINEAGELEVKLPEGVRPSKVKVSIILPEGAIAEIVAKFESGELDLNSWAGVTDSFGWIEELRRRK